MEKTLPLNFIQILSSYIFILVLLVMIRLFRLSKEKEILISSLRMTVQLIIAGYFLTWIFNVNNPWINISVVVGMLVFSVLNIFQRIKFKLSAKIKKIVFISIFTGTFITILYFNFIVLKIVPWNFSRYFIPVSGMLIGNAMTGISLGLNTFINGMTAQKNLIENALMLGASPKHATSEISAKSFEAAFLPTINSMVGMGIVFLPGMMTGQILQGASPISAISYQIIIMLGILGSVSLSVFIFLKLCYKAYFNNQAQLI